MQTCKVLELSAASQSPACKWHTSSLASLAHDFDETETLSNL